MSRTRCDWLRGEETSSKKSVKNGVKIEVDVEVSGIGDMSEGKKRFGKEEV